MTPNNPTLTVECSGDPYTLNDVLDYCHMRSGNPFLEAAHEFLLLQAAEATTLRARLQEAQDAGAAAEERHKAEVLDILRDMRLPRLPLPKTYGPGGEELQGEFDMICGQNKERAAINLYCNQKAYEYSPEGLGPDPVKVGEWDTLPQSDGAALPLQGEEGKGGNRA